MVRASTDAKAEEFQNVSSLQVSENLSLETQDILKLDEEGSSQQNAIRTRAFYLHHELLKLTQQIDDTFLEVGVRLKEIRDRGLYQPLHCPSFTAYAKNLEFSRSRAYALIGVVEDFYLSSRLDKSELLAVGWEKLVLLRTVKDTFTFDSWFRKAKLIGKRQLRQELCDTGFLIPKKEEASTVDIDSTTEATQSPPQEQDSNDQVVYYLAVKKLTAVKKLKPEEVEAAQHSGKYPLIVGVVGSVFSNNGSSLGLPLIPVVRNDLPVLPLEEDDIDGEAE